jgi:ATP-dependent DNA ligase
MSTTPIFDILDNKQPEVIFTKTLYKKDNKGKLRSWVITVTDEIGQASISIDYGQLDGKKANKTTYVKTGKNIGKANETTYQEQACAEAQSKIDTQLKDQYVEDLSNVREAGTKGGGSRQVMLAKPYDPFKKQSGSKDLKGWKIEGKLVGAQIKFDGVRRGTQITVDSVTMYSRGGDRYKTLPHIEKELLESFHKYRLQYPDVEEIWIDGEAYSHEISFNKINGITRKGAKTIEEKEDALKIKYYIYDVMTEECYSERSKLLPLFASENVIVVDTKYVIATEETLREEMVTAVNSGYEGLMIRVLDCGYENKRSNNLLKYKEFEDEEFVILDILPSVEGDRAGTVIVAMKTPTADRDGNPITEFGTGIARSMEDRMYMLKNKHEFIGRMATINYFGKSEYGVPRFGRYKDLRKDL